MRTWVGATGTRLGIPVYWEVDANWSPQPAPGNGDSAIIGGTNGVSYIVTYAPPPVNGGGAVPALDTSLNFLALDVTGGNGTGVSTLNIPGNTLEAVTEYLGFSNPGGVNGRGAINQGGGVNSVGTLYLGYNATDSGTYTLSDPGTVSLAGGTMYIGYGGTGTFNQMGGSNGTQSGFNIILGNSPGSTGTYNLSGGTITIANQLLPSGHEYIGYGGTGVFNQTGGSNALNGALNGNTGGLVLGFSPGSSGTYTLSGSGSLSVVNNVFVGLSGTGVFNQTGGTSTFNGFLHVSDPNNAGSGNYMLSGGTLTTVGNCLIGGAGVMTVSGVGVLNANSGIVVNAGGSLNLSGGTINTPSLNLNLNPAALHWTAGALNFTGDAVFDSGAASPTNVFGSSLTLGAGQTLSVAGNETLGGNNFFTLTLNDGATHTVTGSLTLANLGTLTISGGAVTVGSGNNNTITNDGTITISGNGSLTSNVAENVGTFRSGQVVQSGGTHTIVGPSFLVIGNSQIGIYNLSGGSLISNSAEVIGNNPASTGYFNQVGGSNTELNGEFVGLGYSAGATGTYTLGAGSLNGNIEVGMFGAGTFFQTGGTVTITMPVSNGFVYGASLYVGTSPGSSGAYNLMGGVLTTVGEGADHNEYIGDGGTGVFTQTGGTNTIGSGGQLFIAAEPGSNGTYNLSAGSVTALEQVEVGGFFGNAGGAGVLNVSGTGVLTVGSTLVVFNSAGNAVNLMGGTINAAALNLNGNPSLLRWTGGTLNIANNVTFDSAADPTSTSAAFGSSLMLGAGQTLMISGNEGLGGAGPFTLKVNGGGSHVVSGSLTVNPTGVLALAGGTVTASGPMVNNGQITGYGTINAVAGLTNNTTIGLTGNMNLNGALTIPAGGKIDIANNSLQIGYGSGASPASTIRGYILTGYNNGQWNGTGIDSSAAAADASHRTAIGYADSADGVVQGQVANTVLVRYTIMGDANLDGTVNFADLVTLAQHYGQSNATWDQGDFNYDGVVNFSDLVLLAQNYGQVVSGAAQPSFAAVPEPTGILPACVGIGAAGLRVRRPSR